MTEKECRTLYLEVQEEISELIGDDVLFQYDLEINSSKRILGQCRYNDKVINISKWHLRGSSAAKIEDTIRHEFAHALARYWHGPNIQGHGPEWKDACSYTGASPRARHKGAYDVEKPPSKYTLRCPKCGTESARHRMPRHAKYGCSKCNVEVEVIQHW